MNLQDLLLTTSVSDAIPTSKAYGALRQSGGGMNRMNQLSQGWSSGDFAWHQQLYFGTDYNDVNDAIIRLSYSEVQRHFLNPAGPNDNANIQV